MPREYDCMTYYDFELKAEGFLKSRDWYENIARTQSFIDFKLHGDPKKTRNTNISKFWPLSSDPKAKRTTRTPAELAEAIKKINANGKTANRNRSKKQQRK